MDLFAFDDYKKALRHAVESRRKQFGSRYTFERVAIAAGVQKTYLSRVLNAESHLNPDQLAAAAEFLKLSEAESEFLILLRDFKTASHPGRRERLKNRLEKIRKAHLRTDSVIQTPPSRLAPERTWQYFTDPDLQLIHLFLSVPRYSGAIERIREALGLSEERMNRALLLLQEWQLTEFKNGKYKTREPDEHLSPDSPAYRPFAALQRQRTAERIRQRSEESDYFLSVAFSGEAALQSRLKKKLLAQLKDIRSDVTGSKPEEVFQLNIDLFRWS